MEGDRAARDDASSPKPVVVQAITRLNIGGPAQHVLSTATGLRDRYSFQVVAGLAPVEEGELTGPDVPIERLPLVRSVAPHRDLAALAQMRGVLRRTGADLVHSHMAKAGTVARLAAASSRARPATIHTFHGHVLSGYFSRRSEQVFAEIERRLARKTDRLVAVSDEIRDALLDLGIGRPSQYEVIPLGVDLEPYRCVPGRTGALREPLGVPAEAPLVVVAARLAPIKDHETLLEAMVELPGTHLAVVGDGELRSQLEAVAASLGLRGRVHFTGWRHDMPAVLADADVVALTSRNEGTPMSLIEAAAAGKAIVATDVGGVARVVVDGTTGLLVGSREPVETAAALERLLRDPQLRERMGDAGRNHVQRRFGLQRALDALADLYDELLQRR